MIIFPKRLKMVRNARNLRQVDLAKALGVTAQSVSNWENDNIQPSVEMLVKIANYLKVSTDYLLCINNEFEGTPQTIDVTGLSDETIFHLQLLVSDMKNLQS